MTPKWWKSGPRCASQYSGDWGRARGVLKRAVERHGYNEKKEGGGERGEGVGLRREKLIKRTVKVSVWLCFWCFVFLFFLSAKKTWLKKFALYCRLRLYKTFCVCNLLQGGRKVAGTSNLASTASSFSQTIFSVTHSSRSERRKSEEIRWQKIPTQCVAREPKRREGGEKNRKRKGWRGKRRRRRRRRKKSERDIWDPLSPFSFSNDTLARQKKWPLQYSRVLGFWRQGWLNPLVPRLLAQLLN